MTGGRGDQPAYAALVSGLQAMGHDVLTAHLAEPEVMEEDGKLPPRQVFDRDTAWVRACDAMVAEVSTPSHGVGYEVALALELGKPVLCLHRADAGVSKMLSGNSRPGFQILAYGEIREALGWLESRLR